jgi:hypothetical protein
MIFQTHPGLDLIEKLHELGPKAWLAVFLMGVVGAVIRDAFFWMWVVLGAASLIDWLAGRWAVRLSRPEDFSNKRSREGMYGKALGLVILALLRTMEAILPVLLPNNEFSTRGLFASLIGVALFIDELDSIDRHRQTLGLAPVPLLSWVISKLRTVTGGDRRIVERVELPPQELPPHKEERTP